MIKRKAGGRITGLSTDPKPTAAAEPLYTIFQETDTGKDYYNTGSAWVGRTPSKYAGRTKVYKIGSTYYADKHDGALLSASGTFETVLQAALNQQGLVTIDQPGNFDFNSAGVSIPTQTTLQMTLTTNLRVPVPSTNFIALSISDAGLIQKRHSQIMGGFIMRQSGTSKDWYGIEVKSNTDSVNAGGIAWPVIQDTIIYEPYTAVRFHTTNTLGWITSGYFSRITAFFPIIGYEFVNSGSSIACDRNTFDNCSVQCGADAVYGFYDVQKQDLTFNQCFVWDMDIVTHPTQRTMVINAASSDIKINGGIIARDGGYFQNNSSANDILINADEWNAPKYGEISYIDSILVRNGRRKGTFTIAAGATMGEGLCAAGWPAATGEASNTLTFDYPSGSQFRRRTSGAVSGNAAGARFNGFVTMRGWNPLYITKIRLAPTGTTTNLRAFIGLVSTGSEPTGDDPLSALSGVIFCLRAADTNWQIASNDGTGATVFQSTGVAKGTGIITLKIKAIENQTNKWRWSINNGAWNNVTTTTDVPAQATTLALWNQIQTGETAAKSFDWFGSYLETN